MLLFSLIRCVGLGLMGDTCSPGPPVVLDRIVDQEYGVFLAGTQEVEVIIPLRHGDFKAMKICGRHFDADARTRVQAKLKLLRARGSSQSGTAD